MGFDAEAARAAGINSKLFNSFVDGTKSAIEMAAVANATGLRPQTGGLGFPAKGTGALARVLRPAGAGGSLEHAGTVAPSPTICGGGSTSRSRHRRHGSPDASPDALANTVSSSMRTATPLFIGPTI